MKKTILVFALLILAILTLLHFSKYALILGNTSIEWIIGIVSVLFFFIGIYINKRNQTKTLSIPKEINTQLIEELDISKREYEVLQAIAKGLSNKEIAAQLFLSESTIKTHVSNLLTKLDAKRRTQAIQIAKEQNIL